MVNSDRLLTVFIQAALLVVLAFAGLTPVVAAESDEQVLESGQPVIVDLVRSILGDPARSFSSLHGPSDCTTQAMYLGSRDVLEKYVANPADQEASLRNYLLSGKDQCQCAEAIIGKDFDILLHDLGPQTSGYRTCDEIPYGQAPHSR
jgi:hypothetical protein